MFEIRGAGGGKTGPLDAVARATLSEQREGCARG